MTTPTDLITKALPAIEWIAENTDCPALPDWVTIDPNGNGKIREISDYEIWVHNPPAVLAAICVWVMEVAQHLNSSDDVGITLPYLLKDGRWNTYVVDFAGCPMREGGPCHTYPEATIALLLAIVECLRGGSK